MARSFEWARRAPQHPELMAENEDLEVLGCVGSTRLSGADEETDKGADDEEEEGRYRPIVRGLVRARIGVSDPDRLVDVAVDEHQVDGVRPSGSSWPRSVNRAATSRRVSRGLLRTDPECGVVDGVGFA